MADSLVIAGHIELLGAEGGVPSTIPACAGAVFTLADGYDLSAPQPVVELLAAGSLDGSRPIGRRADNRTVTLPIKITAPDRDTLTNAREILLQLLNEDNFQTVWTRDGGAPMVLDCFRANPATPANQLFEEQELVSRLEVSFSASPYGHSDTLEQLQFPISSLIWDQPPSPVVLDDFTTSGQTLSGQNATFDGGIGNWAAKTNVTVSADAVVFRSGTGSLKMTSVAAGAMVASSAGTPLTQAGAVPCEVGQVCTASAWFKTAVSVRACSVGVEFFDGTGATISTTFGSTANDSTSAWTQVSASVTAPANTALARAVCQVAATGAASEVHNVNDVTLDTGAFTSFLQGADRTFEGTVGNWISAGNDTLAQTAAQAFRGTGALQLTSAAAGNMQAASCPAASYATLMMGVRPGTTIFASAWFRSAVSARSCNIGADFYDANGTLVSTVRGSNITDSTTQWTQAVASLAVPSSAKWARANAQVVSASAGSEVHYLDEVLLSPGPVYSYQDSSQWSLSAVTAVTGTKSAKWARTAQDYPVYDHILPAPIDITGRAKMTFWLGLGSATPTVWRKGTVHFAVTLTDSTGQQISFSGKQFCQASAIDAAPHWQLITLAIAQQSSGFDYTHVARYVISWWNRWDSSVATSGTVAGPILVGQPVLETGAYLVAVTAAATATGASLTRGIFVTMPGVAGSARAPLAIQVAPGTSAISSSVTFTTPGSNPWTAPAITQVDKAEAWGAGGGGAGRSSNVGNPGGGGGGGGEYSARYNVPVTGGNSYPATVGAGGSGGSAGNPGNGGGDSFWFGNAGVGVYAHGGGPGWQSSTWGGSQGGSGSTDPVHFPGGDGRQANASGDDAGGGGGSSGGTGSGGNHTFGRDGAAAPTGGGPGGDGGLASGSPKSGSSPSTGPGGGGGGGSQQSGSSGANGANGQVRLSWGATGIAPLQSLLLHSPDRDAPAQFSPIVPIPTTDTPNGATDYICPQIAGLNARYAGSHTIYLVASSFSSPGSSRTLTLTFKQVPFGGGTAVTQAITRTLTPSTDLTGTQLYVDMGAITLPILDLPPGNLTAEFRVTITSTITADRFSEVLILTAAGQTILFNMGSGSNLNNVWVDTPDVNRPLGLVVGSDADRDRAYSLAQWIDRYSGGPLDVEPGTHNRLLVYSAQGVPGFTASYLPHWWMDRMST